MITANCWPADRQQRVPRILHAVHYNCPAGCAAAALAVLLPVVARAVMRHAMPVAPPTALELLRGLL